MRPTNYLKTDIIPPIDTPVSGGDDYKYIGMPWLYNFWKTWKSQRVKFVSGKSWKISEFY